MGIMLLDNIVRVQSRSTAELTAEELGRLFGPLSGSETVKEYKREHRPKGGAAVYDIVSMLLLYFLMECRRQTYRGITKLITAEEALSLGFPMKDGGVRVPGASTLNEFVNKALMPKLRDGLSREFGAYFIKTSEEGIMTADSTPNEASPKDLSADFNVHYNTRMYKTHMIMTDGMPVCMSFTKGNAGDNPRLHGLLTECAGMGAGRNNTSVFMADGGYDAFGSFADVWELIGVRPVIGTDSGSVYHEEASPEGIDKAVNRLWRKGGHKNMTMPQKLGLLYRNGKKELAGKFLRNMALTDPVRDIRLRDRKICEIAHSAMKQWVDFSVRGIRIKNREGMIGCRFLCIQALCALFVRK